MAEDDQVLALGRHRGEQFAQRLGAPLVLMGRDHEPAFGNVNRGRDLAYVKELRVNTVDGAVVLFIRGRL